MKKNKKPFIIFGSILLLMVAVIFLYFALRDKNKLNLLEKQWLTDNANTIININVPNNVNVFGNSGSGVFFDFINDIEKEYEINLNEVPYSMNNEMSGLSFKVKDSIDKDDLNLYTDHYVLVSKTFKVIENRSALSGKNIGLITNKLDSLSKYFSDINLTFTQSEYREDLIANLNEDKVDYILVPINEYLDTILSNDFSIVYHFSDIKVYYTLSLAGENRLKSSFEKFYNKWMEDSFDVSYNEANLDAFTTNLKISNKDLDILTRKIYNYGFVSTSPYEINLSGTYGGIVATYLQKFSDLTNAEFKFTKYNNQNKFQKAINKSDIDLYFDYYNYEDNYSTTNSLMNIKYYLITYKNNNEVYNSLYSLRGETVYVLNNSILEDELTKINGINVKTYDNEKELKRICRRKNIVLLDSKIYDYYKNNGIKDYNINLTVDMNKSYGFSINGDATFNKLLDKYFSTLDPKMITISGIKNHNTTYENGTLIGKIAKYVLIILLIVLIVIMLSYKYSKRVKMTKKIKKEDKLKYVDMLTSLKNRNYLNENIETWDKNTVYPQSVMIIDLKNVKTINDTYGHEEGDKQIKAAANVIIKNQLDNTDVVRTNGNEFLIYFVGYEEKQIVNYKRKLFKELKKLPYEMGAALGYSMIVDDKKLLDDAINEATIAMREDKKNSEGEA